MTAPRICNRCGAALDAGETCDCMEPGTPSGTQHSGPAG